MTERRTRVAIDAHTVGRRATGNETYVRQLIGSLSVRADVDCVVMADPAASIHPPKGRIHRFRVRNPVLRLLTDLATPGRTVDADLLHVQYVRPPRCDVPVVTTIHDISYEHFPELFTRRAVMRMRATIPWSARHSRLVLTGSAYSRADLIDRYELDARRVRLTPYAADERFAPQPIERVAEALRRLGIPSDYILCVGNLQPRKNLPRLFEAYASLPRDRPPLVVVGQRAWLHEPVLEGVRSLGLDDQVFFTGYVAAEDLPALYSGALVFAYPSLFEGFGLPVVEAMACGAPTLSSWSSSIPEVAGDAAVLVDPTRVDAIAEGLGRLISDAELRRSLSVAGVEQAARFSWARCAAETVAAYRDALMVA